MLSRIYNILKERYDDSDVSAPLGFEYIRRQRFLMSTIGCWPQKQHRRSLYSTNSMLNLLLILVTITLPFLGAGYLWQNWNTITFFDAGHTILCMLLAVWVLQRLILGRSAKYYEMIRDYLLEFHLFFYKEQSEYNAKIYNNIHIISGIFTLYVQLQMTTGVTLFCLKPLYNNYKHGMFSDHPPANGTFEQAVYYYSPNAYFYTDMMGFWLLYICNIPVSYYTTAGLCGFDLVVSTIIFQILGHLQILKHNLLAVPLPTDARSAGMYSIEENVQIRQFLIKNIQHHKLIVEFVDKLSDALSEYLFMFYLILQIVCCILLLEVSAMTPDAIVKYGPLTVGLYQQLIQLSVLFEFINTKSMQLIDVVYSLPWECMDTSNRKMVAIFLHRVQTPVSLKAGKMVPVGVKTMAAILRTAISYYIMLLTVAGDR